MDHVDALIYDINKWAESRHPSRFVSNGDGSFTSDQPCGHCGSRLVVLNEGPNCEPCSAREEQVRGPLDRLAAAVEEVHKLDCSNLPEEMHRAVVISLMFQVVTLEAKWQKVKGQ